MIKPSFAHGANQSPDHSSPKGRPAGFLAGAAVGFLAAAVVANLKRPCLQPSDVDVPVSTPTPTPPAEWPDYVVTDVSQVPHMVTLGVRADGSEIGANLFISPHALVVGRAGGGKSMVVRNYVRHALMHDFQIAAFDLKRDEFDEVASRSPDRFLGNATTVEDAAVLAGTLNEILDARFEALETMGGSGFADLDEGHKRILVVVDEIGGFAPTGGKDDESRRLDGLRDDVIANLAKVARIGRAAGIYLVVTAQRADSVLPGEFKSNLNTRIAVAKMGPTPSLMTLNTESATSLPQVPGIAILQVHGDEEVMKVGFVEPDALTQ